MISTRSDLARSRQPRLIVACTMLNDPSWSISPQLAKSRVKCPAGTISYPLTWHRIRAIVFVPGVP